MTLLVVVLSQSANVFGQGQSEDCEQTLIHATEEFHAGHFYSIPLILSTCLNKFSNEQQIRASILLTQTYLLLDDLEGAKKSFLRVLKANPEFKADENLHPVDLVYLSKNFITTPIFSWYFGGGINSTPVRIIHDIDVFDNRVYEDYQLRLGYNAALGFDFYFKPKMGIRLEANYTVASFQHVTRNFFQDDSKDYFETQTWLSVPLLYTYGREEGRYRPYAYGGVMVGRLIRDVSYETIQKVRTAEGEQDDQRSPTWNFLYKRNRMNYSILAGGGLKTKIGLNFLFVDVRYSLGLSNVVDSNNLYGNSSVEASSEEFINSNTPTSAFGHVDDLFRIDNMSFSIGFLKPIYKPREMRKNNHGILRFLKRS